MGDDPVSRDLSKHVAGELHRLLAGDPGPSGVLAELAAVQATAAGGTVEALWEVLRTLLEYVRVSEGPRRAGPEDAAAQRHRMMGLITDALGQVDLWRRGERLSLDTARRVVELRGQGARGTRRYRRPGEDGPQGPPAGRVVRPFPKGGRRR